MVVERVVELVEEHRLLGHRRADLGGVLAVVEPDADDLLRAGHQRAVLEPGLLQEGRVGGRRRQRGGHQRLQRRSLLALQQVVHGGRGGQLEQGRGPLHVEHALGGPGAEPVLATHGEGEEGEAAGHAAGSPGGRRRTLLRRIGPPRHRRHARRARHLEEAPPVHSVFSLAPGRGRCEARRCAWCLSTRSGMCATASRVNGPAGAEASTLPVPGARRPWRSAARRALGGGSPSCSATGKTQGCPDAAPGRP